jgi:hypothetical protein
MGSSVEGLKLRRMRSAHIGARAQNLHGMALVSLMGLFVGSGKYASFRLLGSRSSDLNYI